MKFLLKIFTLILLVNLLVPSLALAQDTGVKGGSEPLNRLKGIVKNKDFPSYDESTSEYSLSRFAGLLISVVLGLLGVIFLVLMIFAGYRWMTAGGNEEQVSKAGSTIRLAIIGLLIVIGSFAIWRFVLERIISVR